MKKFKGTKGEWKIFDYKGKGPVIDIVLDDQFGSIAQVFSPREISHSGHQGEELKANARVICKSKKTLKALIETNEIIGRLTDAYLKKHYAKIAIKYDENKKLIESILGS